MDAPQEKLIKVLKAGSPMGAVCQQGFPNRQILYIVAKKQKRVW